MRFTDWAEAWIDRMHRRQVTFFLSAVILLCLVTLGGC